MEKEQTEIEEYIISVVRKKREALNLSQRALSIKLGLEESFVGHAESLHDPLKFNVNHINELAKFFECSIYDFFPDPPLATNCILEYQEIMKRRKKERAKLKGEKDIKK